MSCCGVSGAGSAIRTLWQWGALDFGNSVLMRFMHSAASATAVGATEDNSVVLVMRPGLLTELRVRIQTALAAANTTFTVRVNGVNTALAVTVNAGAQVGLITGSVAVVAGDRVSLATQTTVADATTSRPRAAVQFVA